MEKENVENVVFIGSKPFVNYINATRFQLDRFDKIIIRARGKFTSKAIDVSQVLQSRNDVKIDDIKLFSEEFKRKEDDKLIKTSSIDITIVKKGK